MGIVVRAVSSDRVCGFQSREMAYGRTVGGMGVWSAGGERAGGGIGDADAVRVRVRAGAVAHLRGGLVSETLADKVHPVRGGVCSGIDAVDRAQLEGFADTVWTEPV